MGNRAVRFLPRDIERWLAAKATIAPADSTPELV